MKEIGSEFSIYTNFYKNNNNEFNELLNFGDDWKLLLSGRTGIDYILEDIGKPIKNVYMPSYCCESMLQPFKDRDIAIDYYNVMSKNGTLEYEIDYSKDIDIFFGMSYFGFNNTNMDNFIKTFSDNNVIVIEDLTHRLLSLPNHSKNADYYFASLRKWFPILSGGFAIKRNNKFKKILLKNYPVEILNKKKLAMVLKDKYLNNENIDKKDFLSLFEEFNKSIRQNYKNISIDKHSIDLLNNIEIDSIRRKRIENARFITESVKNMDNISLLIKDIDFNKDCPLFVPILVNERYRDKLWRFLIEKDIYCPIHWPKSEGVYTEEDTEKIYKEELSLICDQRYGVTDLNKIIKMIGEFLSII